MEIVRGGSDTSRSEPSVAMLRRFGAISPAAITMAVGEVNQARSFEGPLDVVLPERREEWEQVVRVMLLEHADFIAAPQARDEVACYYGPLQKLIARVVRDATQVNEPPA